MIKDRLEQYIEHFEKKDQLGSLFKMKIMKVDENECLCEYTVQEAHYNPNGILHGGALYSVMDSSQGAFIHLNLDPQFKYAATGTATIKYLAPVREGKVLIRTWF
ncbi:MAG: PaaI family thioesterase, partial [Pseudobdellovibrio sp.]